MTRLILLILIGLGAWQAWERWGPVWQMPDEVSGGDRVLLFTHSQCGSLCDNAGRFLLRRNVPTTHYEVDTNPEGMQRFRELGGQQNVPYVVIGKRRFVGGEPAMIIPALAEAWGQGALSPDEQRALALNFNSRGRPRIVMYATETCGYCRQARRWFESKGLKYIEFDIERDSQAKRDFDMLGGLGTPLIFRGYRSAMGFNPAEIASQLNI